MYVPANVKNFQSQVGLADNNGDAIVGVAFNSSLLKIEFLRSTDQSYQVLNLIAGSIGTWSPDSWVELGSGVYQLCLRDTLFSPGQSLGLRITYGANAPQLDTISAVMPALTSQGNANVPEAVSAAISSASAADFADQANANAYVAATLATGLNNELTTDRLAKIDNLPTSGAIGGGLTPAQAARLNLLDVAVSSRQSETGGDGSRIINTQVRSQSGSAVVGGQITIQDTAGKLVAFGSSQSNGDRLLLLDPGSYTISIVATGFPSMNSPTKRALKHENLVSIVTGSPVHQ
jgi:hypothetical protein